jgi:hypothetical protein
VEKVKAKGRVSNRGRKGLLGPNIKAIQDEVKPGRE